MTEWVDWWSGTAAEALDAGLVGPGTATITAVDREAGTITVNSFNRILKELYSSDVVANVIASEAALFGTVRSSDLGRLAGCKVSRPKPGELTTAAVVALTTFCALEWLRHRKAEVARAEQTGDFAPLIAEFVAWLRALLASWRGKLGEPE